jgi:hypothetical protein
MTQTATPKGSGFITGNRAKVAPFCPCGKSNKDGKFVPFKDDLTGGKCHGCGEVFAGNQKTEQTRKVSNPDRLPEIKFYHSAIIARTMKCYESNNFVIWLIRVLGKDKAAELIRLFFIGTHSDGSALLPLVDQEKRALNAKKMKFPDQTGHRGKGPYDCFHLGKESEGYTKCLFGLHQLTDRPNDSIIITEAEKGALIGTAFYPEYIWMAAGGANGITYEKAAPLIGRQVIILFDLDESGRNGSKDSAEVLRKYGCEVLTHDLDPSRSDKADIVDLIIEEGNIPVLPVFLKPDPAPVNDIPDWAMKETWERLRINDKYANKYAKP